MFDCSLWLPQVYSVNNDEAAGASVEFVVPKDLGDGYVNNKLENYKFRSVLFCCGLLTLSLKYSWV